MAVKLSSIYASYIYLKDLNIYDHTTSAKYLFDYIEDHNTWFIKNNKELHYELENN
jgi:hypothetical protein